VDATDKAPKDEAPKDEAPKDEAPKDEVPRDEVPKVPVGAQAILPPRTDSHHLHSPSSCPALPAPPSVDEDQMVDAAHNEGSKAEDHVDAANVDQVPKDEGANEDDAQVPAPTAQAILRPLTDSHRPSSRLLLHCNPQLRAAARHVPWRACGEN